MTQSARFLSLLGAGGRGALAVQPRTSKLRKIPLAVSLPFPLRRQRGAHSLVKWARSWKALDNAGPGRF